MPIISDSAKPVEKQGGRPACPEGRYIWKAGISGRPVYLEERYVRKAGMSGRLACLYDNDAAVQTLLNRSEGT